MSIPIFQSYLNIIHSATITHTPLGSVDNYNRGFGRRSQKVFVACHRRSSSANPTCCHINTRGTGARTTVAGALYAPQPNYYHAPEPDQYSYPPQPQYYSLPPPPEGINLFFGIQ
jgi:hypothetical protein